MRFIAAGPLEELTDILTSHNKVNMNNNRIQVAEERTAKLNIFQFLIGSTFLEDNVYRTVFFFLICHPNRVHKVAATAGVTATKQPLHRCLAFSVSLRQQHQATMSQCYRLMLRRL